jgi:hypothetical protein
MALFVYMKNAGRSANLKRYARLQLFTGKCLKEDNRADRCTKTNSLCSKTQKAPRGAFWLNAKRLRLNAKTVYIESTD